MSILGEAGSITTTLELASSAASRRLSEIDSGAEGTKHNRFSRGYFRLRCGHGKVLSFRRSGPDSAATPLAARLATGRAFGARSGGRGRCLESWGDLCFVRRKRRARAGRVCTRDDGAGAAVRLL